MLNERELHARYEIMLETYNKTINIEGQLMVLMANRYILPAALEYQKQVGAERRGGEGGGRQVGRRQEAARRAHQAGRRVQARRRQARRRRSSTKAASAEKHAKYFRDKVVPAMAALRETGDELEVHHAARDVAAADLSRDAVHQVAGVDRRVSDECGIDGARRRDRRALLCSRPLATASAAHLLPSLR